MAEQRSEHADVVAAAVAAADDGLLVQLVGRRPTRGAQFSEFFDAAVQRNPADAGDEDVRRRDV